MAEKHAGGRPAGSGKPAAKHGAHKRQTDKPEKREPKKPLRRKPGEDGGRRA